MGEESKSLEKNDKCREINVTNEILSFSVYSPFDSKVRRFTVLTSSSHFSSVMVFF